MLCNIVHIENMSWFNLIYRKPNYITSLFQIEFPKLL